LLQVGHGIRSSPDAHAVLAWPEREIYPSVRRSFVELRVDEWKGKILRFPAALNPVRRLTLLPEMYRSMTAIGRNAVWLDFADRRRLHPVADGGCFLSPAAAWRSKTAIDLRTRRLLTAARNELLSPDLGEGV